MLIVVGIVLLATMAYLCREALRAEFLLVGLKNNGSYEAVEAVQIANFGRRVLIAITGATGGLCFAWGLAPDAMGESWQQLLAIVAYFRH